MNGIRINKDTRLEPKVYFLPEGITIDSNNVTLDGQGATIMGSDKTGQGIRRFWSEKYHHKKPSYHELLPWDFDQTVQG